MKKNLKYVMLSAILLMLKGSIWAQDDYIPLLERANQWNELVENFSLPPALQYQRTYITKIGSDTLIDNVNYYKLLTAKNESADIWLEDGCIREDIENRKVYYRPHNKPEMLLYDFDAQLGDEIQSYDLQYNIDAVIKVEAVSYVLIGGKMRKQMNIRSVAAQDIFYDETHTWIEGIGNMDGFLQSTMAIRGNGSDKISLLCFFQNGDLVYKPENTTITGCFVWKQSGVQFIKNDNISIFPNPVDDLLNISCSDKAISRIEIFDNLGQKVYSQTYEETIDVSSFSKGLYLLKIYDTNGQVSILKIIKE